MLSLPLSHMHSHTHIIIFNYTNVSNSGLSSFPFLFCFVEEESRIKKSSRNQGSVRRGMDCRIETKGNGLRNGGVVGAVGGRGEV